MAAAEARAAWQRAANRCFVQEDAKRAPKLPPPPPPCSSSCSSVSHTDTDTNHQTNSQLQSHHDSDEHHKLILNLTPLNWNPYPISTVNLRSDTRWWLQLHPNFAYQREFLLYEPKNHVPPHPATKDPISPSPDFNFDQVDPPKTSQSMSFIKHAGSIDKNVEDRKLRYDVKSCEEPLMLKKREPWWRVADGEELASMVAQKAAQHVENCDLPRPTQTLCYSCSDLYSDLSTKVGMTSFGDADLDSACDSDNMPSRKVFPPGLCDDSFQGCQHPLCSNDKFRMQYSTRCRSEWQSNGKEGKDGREELLEALCHSQTRARQAEMAAKKALSEKDDIMKLLFKQASHLFACKQWLKMLQLENLCLQLRIRDHHFPFPALLPFNSKLPTPHPHPPPPHLHKKPSKICKGGNSICRYVVVFAVGWGLAGAGLLLGWTLGWLLPKL